MLPKIIFPLASVALLAVLPSDGQVLMSHKNSTVSVGTNGISQNWTVDGVSQMTYQALFYRVGSAGGESILGGISSSPSVTFNQVPNVLSSLDITYANAAYSVRTLFQLSGNTAGSGKANLNQTITVQNLSGNPLDFHFFQLNDFDLNNVYGGQTAQVHFDGLLQPYKITQTDGVRTATETVNANSAPVGHYEVSLYPALENSLTDSLPTTLADTTAAGPGDVAFAYQWDMVLQPNQSLTISKLMSIVPEPATGSLVLAALGVIAWRRRMNNN